MVQIQPTCDHAEFLNPTDGRRCEKIDFEKIDPETFWRIFDLQTDFLQIP
jgi:hypothetical protein